METSRVPSFEDIVSASEQIKSWAVRTPILHNESLDEAVGGKVYIKPETLQRTGSFKFRGAFNALSRLDADQRKRGVVGFSSGNHAQGVAEAARLLKIPAQIVMPADAPEIKKRGVINRGAEIIEYDRASDDREAICREIAQKSGRTVIPSFDHPDIIAGQGTTGLEIFQQISEQKVVADQLVCCIGGGGLIAGIGLAAKEMSPQTKIYGAEPEGFDDHARSLKLGERVRNEKTTGSICDALMSEQPGQLTFQLNRSQMSGVAVVSDDEVRHAMRFAFEALKLVVEPGGAAALAALLSEKVETRDRTSVIVLTGGNVDPDLYARIIS